jgi:acetolactate synthase small subunit
MEQVFFPQENNTITLSFANNPDAQHNMIEVMDQLKNVLKTIGVDMVTFNADKAMVTIITTEDKKDEILRLTQDFGATVVQSGF